eukprot:Skav205644  [mRNA]  locus=scaffold458:98794:105314:+ [translate_table: standard]
MAKVHLTRGASDIFASVVYDQKAKDTLVGCHIIPFLYFKEALDVEHVRQTLFEKLMPIARFRSKVESVPGFLRILGRRSAYVELDDDTMKASFGELVSAPVGLKTESDLDHFVSGLYSEAWNPMLPLWRAYVINDLQDGRSLLLMKIDHAMADGVGLLEVLFHIIDPTETTGAKLKSGAQPGQGRAIERSCGDGFLLHLKGWWRAIFRPFLGELLPGDPQNRLKFRDATVAGKTKTVATTDGIDLEEGEIKAIKFKIPGATVNDVLMTLMCLTLRRYFMRYEPSTLTQAVSATIPVSMRRDEEEDIFDPKVFGNNFSMAQLYFPLEVDDPMEAFRRVKAQIDVIKVSPEPGVRQGQVKCLTACAVPQSFSASLLMGQFGRVTATLSNVIGPLEEVNFMGQAVDDLSFYAMVPLGLYLGVVQYKGRIKARRFIQLLDVDSSGSISIDEFLRGGLRYRGLATGVDMHACLRVVQRTEKAIHDLGHVVKGSGASHVRFDRNISLGTRTCNLSSLPQSCCNAAMDHDELDPADADALDDRTTAAAATSSGAVVDLPTTRGRLRLRSAVPVAEGYEGTAVSRNDYFETKDDEADDEKYQLLEQQLDDQLDVQMASGLSISGDVEEEYNKLMRETQQELSVMRQPSAEDVAQKQADAQHLKQQIGMWAALVETRIHLEAPLSVGHRLPSGLVAGLFHQDAQVAEHSKTAAREATLGHGGWGDWKTWAQVVSEPESWKMLDGRLQSALDWALVVADDWKACGRAERG